MPPVILLPVKDFEKAKHRMARFLASEERSQLAWAMFQDVAKALQPICPASRIAIVTDSTRAAAAARQLNWRIFWPLINVPFVGLPNLIAGREIVPELLQDEVNRDRLCAEITSLLDDTERLQRQRSDLLEVRLELGSARASERAAQRILDLLGA